MWKWHAMSERFALLPLDALQPDPNQPRREMESENRNVTEAHTLQGLANSIREVGILQPIRVRSIDTQGQAEVAGYLIVSGQRRYEAARMVGLKEVPCLVVETPQNAAQTLVSQVTENLQRKAMTATELALAVQSLTQSGHTQDEVARKLGIQPSQVTLLLNLLSLGGPAQSAFERGRVESPRAAYDLNKLPPAVQEQLIAEAEHKDRVITQRDVREAKQLYAQQLSQVRHRYEAVLLTQQDHADVMACLDDGVQDRYDPSEDRFAVFGPDWPRLHERQTGRAWSSPASVSAASAHAAVKMGELAASDPSDGLEATLPRSAMEPMAAEAWSTLEPLTTWRVRLPALTLTWPQVQRLYACLGATPPVSAAMPSHPGDGSESLDTGALAKDLVQRLTAL
jgi:ParB/RepB/Spo0J family partition protein